MLTSEKEDAIAKVQATDRLKEFLTKKLTIDPKHDRGLILAVKDEWRKLLASEDGASFGFSRRRGDKGGAGAAPGAAPAPSPASQPLSMPGDDALLSTPVTMPAVSPIPPASSVQKRSRPLVDDENVGGVDPTNDSNVVMMTPPPRNALRRPG